MELFESLWDNLASGLGDYGATVLFERALFEASEEYPSEEYPWVGQIKMGDSGMDIESFSRSSAEVSEKEFIAGSLEIFDRLISIITALAGPVLVHKIKELAERRDDIGRQHG